MREKREYYVAAFYTTDAAMAMEHFCERKGINGRLIPVPREISAGCGLSWRMTPEEFERLSVFIKEYEKGNTGPYRLSAGDVAIEIEMILTLML